MERLIDDSQVRCIVCEKILDLPYYMNGLVKCNACSGVEPILSNTTTKPGPRGSLYAPYRQGKGDHD